MQAPLNFVQQLHASLLSCPGMPTSALLQASFADLDFGNNTNKWLRPTMSTSGLRLADLQT